MAAKGIQNEGIMLGQIRLDQFLEEYREDIRNWSAAPSEPAGATP